MDEWNGTDPTLNRRDFTPTEAPSTTALRKCSDAYKDWSKADTPQTRQRLVEARIRFQQSAKAVTP